MSVLRTNSLPHDNPVTVRFDVVNLFDTVYLIRDGSGIGVFAPQYGPRRGFFVGVSKKFEDPEVEDHIWKQRHIPGRGGSLCSHA